MDATFQRVTKIFYLTRIWQEEEESAFGRNGRKFFFMFHYFLFQIFLITCAALSENATEAIFLASIEILLSVVTIKLIYLLWKKDKIYEFLLDPIVKQSIAYAATFKHFGKDIKIFVQFLHSYMSMFVITFVFYLFSTLPWFTDGKKLPFFITFTLEGKYSEMIYWLSYAFLLSEILFGYICSLINILIWYTMFTYSLEYQELGMQFRNLGMNKMCTTARWYIVQPSSKTDFHRDLIRLIQNHRKIFRTIAQFKTCFSNLFTAQIATSGITTCISAYVLAYSTNDNLLQIPIFLAILMYGMFDIFLVMYLANDINVASSKLSYCLFESNWVGQSKSSLKTLLILGEAVKHSQQLVILKVYPMNLETFKVILKSAYSLFNILQTFN